MSKTKKQLAYQTLGIYSLIEASSMQQTITWDMINQAFEQPIQIMEGDVNARTILLKITDNGSVLDLTGYSVKLTYQYMYNFKVNNEEVWFYFNEEADEEHSDIDEVSSHIIGCLYMNDKEYPVVGEKEVEGLEIETTLIIYITDMYYIEVCQEIENAENEYEFTYYHQNKKQKSLENKFDENGIAAPRREAGINGMSIKFRLKIKIMRAI